MEKLSALCHKDKSIEKPKIKFLGVGSVGYWVPY